MANPFYNVGSKSIDSELRDYEISSGQDYFILLSAPSNANVRIRLNENTAPQIPIKEFWQFKSKDVTRIYISADAVAGGSITWGQADGNLEIITNPTIDAIDSIGQMGITYAEQLDKVTNPYDMANSTRERYNMTASSTMGYALNSTLNCDAVMISIAAGPLNATSTSKGEVSIDGCRVLTSHCNMNNGLIAYPPPTLFEGVRGKSILIYGGHGMYCTVQEINYKV